MSGMWKRPFTVVSDGKDAYYVVARVEEKAARRASAMIAESDDNRERLARTIEDAVNLAAMPMLIRRSK